MPSTDTSQLEKLVSGVPNTTTATPGKEYQSSTELLQKVLDSERGKKKETFGSKLTDTDTLTRFILGAAMMASGEEGAIPMGAAMLGAGFKNIGDEVSIDNKAQEGTVRDLEMKQIGLVQDQEQFMRQIGVANPEAVRALGKEDANKFMGLPKELDLWSAIDKSAIEAENKKQAEVWLGTIENFPIGDERRLHAAEMAVKLYNFHDVDGLAENLAAGKVDEAMMFNVGAQADKDVFVKAWAVYERDKGKDQAAARQVFFDTLRGPAIRDTSTEGELKFKTQLRVSAIVAKGYEAFYSESNKGKWANPEDALNDPSVISPEDMAYLDTFGNDVSDSDLQTPEQKRMDMELFGKEKDNWRELILAREKNKQIEGQTPLTFQEMNDEAIKLATQSLAMNYEVRYGMSFVRAEANAEAVSDMIVKATGLPAGPGVTRMAVLAINTAYDELVAEDSTITAAKNFQDLVVERAMRNQGLRPDGNLLAPTRSRSIVLPGAEGTIAAQDADDAKKAAKDAADKEQKVLTDINYWADAVLGGRGTTVETIKSAAIARAKKLYPSASNEDILGVYNKAANFVQARLANSGTTDMKFVGKEVMRAMEGYAEHQGLGAKSGIIPKAKPQPITTDEVVVYADKEHKPDSVTPAEVTQGAINTGVANAVVGAANAKDRVVEMIDNLIIADHFAEINSDMEARYLEFADKPSKEVRDALKAADTEAKRLDTENKRVAAIKRELASSGADKRAAIERGLKQAVEDSLKTEEKLQGNLRRARLLHIGLTNWR